MGNSAYSATVYSDPAFDPDARAKPPRPHWETARNFLSLLERDLPGQWSDNRRRQVEHFRSVPYIAIRAIMDLVGGSSYQLMRRTMAPRGTTTFGPGGFVSKSTPQGQQQGRDEDYTPFDDYDHPLAELIRCPNPNESMGEFVARVVLQNRLTGVGPVWAVGSKQDPSRPVQLWALRTPFIYPLPPSQDYPRGAWRVQPYNAVGWVGSLPFGLSGTAGAILPGEDVKRFMDPHPVIDWDGYSPMTAGAIDIDVFDSVVVSRKSSMDRGTNLDTVIIMPGAGPDGVRDAINKLEARHMGADKARRVVGIDPGVGMDGKFDIKSLNGTPRDMDYPAGYDQTLKMLLAYFGVPPTIAGLDESDSYAKGYAARQQFYDRQEDYLGRLAVWFTREFCRPWESYPDEFVLRIKPRPIDDKEMSETKHARQCQVGTITYNESRAKDDMPPVPGGDVPVPIYLAKLQQDMMPQPVVSPSVDTQGKPESSAKPSATPASGPPHPANPAGKGSLPPRPGVSKSAMSSAEMSTGGALVPPADSPRGRIRRPKRGLRRVLARCLKSLGG